MALFLYFYTESLLRVRVVNNANDESFTVNSIVEFFPASMRENVQYQLEMFKLEDQLKAAKTDEEKLYALNSMAFLNKSKDKKREIYLRILNEYPNEYGSASAYAYFLLSKDPEKSISLEEYQKYINNSDSLNRLSIFQTGLQKLKSYPKNIKYKYWKLLLSMKPQYKESYDLYKKLYYLAIQKKDDRVAKIAKSMMDIAINKPSINVVYEKKIKQKVKK